MSSLRPQNQKCNQTMDGSAPSPKFRLDLTQPIDSATKHTVGVYRNRDQVRRASSCDGAMEGPARQWKYAERGGGRPGSFSGPTCKWYRSGAEDLATLRHALRSAPARHAATNPRRECVLPVLRLYHVINFNYI